MATFSRIFFFSSVCVLSAFQGIAQNRTNDLGNWLMYFGTNKLSDKWSIHSEIQWRNHMVQPNIEQLLIRGGLNYYFDANNSLTAGYSYISSHPYNKDEVSRLSTEHRIWQQFITKNSLWRIFFEHRYRLEQRWVDGDFRSRGRYRIMASIPLNKPKLEPNAVFVGVYDEVFLNIQSTGVFDRNRLYGAIGYQFCNSTSVQVGLLNQAVDGFNKYYLQFAVFFNPKFYKEKEE